MLPSHPGLVDTLVRRIRSGNTAAGAPACSPEVRSARERQVLQRLAGRRDKQIAAELGLSAYGVRFHLRNLFAKLGARNRAEALRRAREIGLIPGDS